MDRLFDALSRSVASSARLRRGQVFLPAYLKKRALTDLIFPPVAKIIAKRLRLDIDEQIGNPFPDEYRIGWKRQVVDFVFTSKNGCKYFLELESLDRAQLHLFLPHGGKTDESKLWYYWGTLCKKNEGYDGMPRYFVFLLILPDQRVGTIPWWDAGRYYKLFSPRLRRIVQSNPFSFYDRMIKTCARLFLNKTQEIIGRDGQWRKGRLQDFQDICELVIVTCTGRQLIMSRGKDEFDPAKEKQVLIGWK